MTTKPDNNERFRQACTTQRAFCKEVEGRVREIRHEIASTDPLEVESADYSEVRANLTLAIRHLEDARMRLGKTIQYAGDGVSKYDK